MESGKIQSKFLRDLEAIDGLFGNVVRLILPNVIMTLIFAGISIYKSGAVSLFFLVAVPLNLLLVFIFRKKMSRNSRVFRLANEELSSNISTTLEMYAVTKAHGLEQTQYSSVLKSIEGVMNKGMRSDKDIASFGSVAWVLGNMLSCGCVVFCAFLAVKRLISVGDIVLYQTMFVSINSFVQGIVGSFPALTAGAEGVRSVSEVINSDEIEKQGGRIITPIKGDINLENVSFWYHEGESHVIKNLNLHISPGETVALVGASGSGKSTICNMIIGFLTANEGQLLIDGIPITQLNLTDYRRNIAVVPQNALLFTGSIRENITYGLAEYSEEQLRRVLEMANINEFLADFPNGVDTNVGEHGGLLSGGQRQRITIARALMRDPKILILDEATSALDNISEAQVKKAVAESVKSRTTLIVAHRLSTVRDADYIVVMSGGECVEKGSYDELMSFKGEFYKMNSGATGE
jgi:ATP-binding cassette subfamily B protein